MELCEEVAEGVFQIEGKRSNSYLLTDKQVQLIDTGMPGDEEKIIAVLHSLGYVPGDLNCIFITHAHLDHVGGLAALKKASNARIVAGAADAAYVEGRRMFWRMNREGMGGKLFKLMLLLLEICGRKYRPSAVDVAWQSGRGPEMMGDVQILATPGHSPGSLCFRHMHKKILFTGDALSGAKGLRLPPRAGCADYAAALDSVSRLARLDVALCLFGHGPPLADNVQSQLLDLVKG